MPDAPGSGALNAGYAVTYGDLGETNRMNLVNLLDRQNEERQQRLQAQQQADAAHKFALQKYYGNQFNPDNYKTDTDLDKRLSDMAGNSLKRVSDLINSGASDQDIESAANQEAGGLQKTYQIISTVKRNVDGSLEGLQNDKTLAPYLGSLKKQALVHALYTKDPKTGQLRLKNDQELSQVDPNQNFAGDILQHTPELVVPGDVDYNGFLKTLPVANQKLTGEWYSSPGVKHKSAFDASWYDGAQKLVQDHKGAYHIETANEPIETTDPNGNPIKINQIPQSVINTMQSTPGAKAKLDVATMQYLAQHSPNVSVEPGTPAFETAKKAMVYDMLDKNAPKRISQGQEVNKSASLIKLELGYPMPGSGNKGNGNGDSNADISASFKDINGADFESSDGIKGTIENGVFQPEKKGLFSPLYGRSYKPGQEMTGTIPIDKLPASVYKAAQAYISNNDITGETVPGTDKDGNPTSKEVPTGRVKVKIGADGQIKAIRTDKGWFDVGDRENANINIVNKGLSIKHKIPSKLPDAKTKKTAADYGL
jgi:hypothetical protein